MHMMSSEKLLEVLFALSFYIYARTSRRFS